jgi:hypothetical protein
MFPALPWKNQNRVRAANHLQVFLDSYFLLVCAVAGLALIMRISSVFSVCETIDLIPSKFHAIPVMALLGNDSRCLTYKTDRK